MIWDRDEASARLPAFALPDERGGVVRSASLLGRLAFALALAGEAQGRAWVAGVAAAEGELRDWGVETLWVAPTGEAEWVGPPPGPLPAVRALREAGAAGSILLDTGGELHRRLGAVDETGRPRPALLIVERGGTVRFRQDGGELDPGPAVAWARYLAIREPECGTCAPAWPDDLEALEEERDAHSR